MIKIGDIIEIEVELFVYEKYRVISIDEGVTVFEKMQE